MNISEKELLLMLESAFRAGMVYGYGVNHENIENDENEAWKEYQQKIISKYFAK